MRDFRGCRVLITGAGHGLGREFALGFAREKAKVILTDMNPEALEETAKLVSEISEAPLKYVFDVTSLSALLEFVSKIHKDAGKLDVLVNNAGVVFGGEFLNVPLSQHVKTYEVNIVGLMALTHSFLPDLIESKNAALINMASGSAFIGLPFGVSYASSKWAVLGFSESLREELELLGHHHVGVTAVSPGYIATGMFQGSRPFAFSQMLSADTVVRETIKGAKRGVSIVSIPWFVCRVPAMTTLLPRMIWRWILKRAGVTTSMTHWTGHGKEKA